MSLTTTSGRTVLDSPEERRHVVARGHNLNARLSGEEMLKPFEDENAVVRDGDLDRHDGNDTDRLERNRRRQTCRCGEGVVKTWPGVTGQAVVFVAK